MASSVYILFALNLTALVGGFLAIGARLGRLELKIDTMWDWWLVREADPRKGGRRFHDPPAGLGE